MDKQHEDITKDNAVASETGPQDPSASVRFASANQEIEPSYSIHVEPQPDTESAATMKQSDTVNDPIHNLTQGLHRSHIMQRSMSNFNFEPCSLPASRVPSNESTPNRLSAQNTGSANLSPKASPVTSAMPTPPLSRNGSGFVVGKTTDGSKASGSQLPADPQVAVSPKEALAGQGEISSTSLSMSRPSTGEQGSTQPTSLSQESSGDDHRSRKAMGFSIGPSDSASPHSGSREPSPASKVPEHNRGSVFTPEISRPRTPVGNKEDPYARSKRPPQPKKVDDIEARFKFGSTDARRRSGINAGSVDYSAALPQPRSQEVKNDHRKSTFSLMGGKDHPAQDGHKDKHDKHHGSMSNLQRFFGIGSHHHKAKRAASPAPSARGSIDNSNSRTSSRHGSSIAVPFGEDHGLEKKYGKFSKLLGSGAGGSVRLMTRASDKRTFAVKQFRDRHNYESVRDYNKKVTAEFCIGSTLHHGNIIETLDIVQEGGRWYEVMEYAPFDLFAIVMTGKMTREEVTCCFLQIVNGVAFLHASGLAHRDLKLDNVVVNEHGIMKIIDFGSASVFQYPFENDIILASGIVGSDPYLAPEVYDKNKYDPQPADIWSLAIIFACMTLKRFPWKAPRYADSSFKLFVAEPNTYTVKIEPEAPSKDDSDPTHPTPDGGGDTDTQSNASHHHHHHHHHHRHHDADKETTRIEAPKGEVIKGPWRLLRLLPRETRSIMGHMLKVDPVKRAKLTDIYEDAWVKNAPVCSQVEGQIKRLGVHEHVLEPGTSQPPANKD